MENMVSLSEGHLIPTPVSTGIQGLANIDRVPYLYYWLETFFKLFYASIIKCVNFVKKCSFFY